MTPLNSLSVMTESYIMIKEFLKEDPAKKVKSPSKNVEGPSKNVEGPSKKVEGTSKNVEEPLAPRDSRVGNNFTEVITQGQGVKGEGVTVEGQGVTVEGQGTNIQDPRQIKLDSIKNFKEFVEYINKYPDKDKMKNDPTFQNKLKKFNVSLKRYSDFLEDTEESETDELNNTLESLSKHYTNGHYNKILEEIDLFELTASPKLTASTEWLNARVNVERLKNELSELTKLKPRLFGARQISQSQEILIKQKELLDAEHKLEIEEQQFKQQPQLLQKRLTQSRSGKPVQETFVTTTYNNGIPRQSGTSIGGSFNPLLKNIN